MPCPSDDTIAGFLEDRLSEDDRAEVLAHLDGCSACRVLVGDATPPGDEAPARLARGATIDRYVILEVLGAGAMGVVYAAWDPELGRRVALKLLRADALAQGTPEVHGPRLAREARAMARLAHPNVIAVHDVGSADGRLFIAMELVDGGTLGEWLRAAPRPWREVLVRFRQAGEGLCAAHAAGLVHRDFKPDNVLLGEDGRARVTDFGLAMGAGPAADDASKSADAGPLGLTRTGALVGTPAYMAPEQLDGAAADARADLFGFCVALYEGLFGVRPFPGTEVPALRAAIARGELAPPAAGRRVPGWLRRVVARGLAADPAARPPSLRALLTALDPRRRLSVPVAAAAVSAAVVVGAVGLLAPPAHPCGGAASAWGTAWDDAARAAVTAAFTRAAGDAGARAAASVGRALDGYRDAWIAGHGDACAATRVRGEQSEVLLDTRMRCLAVRRDEAAALTRLLREADRPLVDRAVAAATSLPDVDDCANARALGGLTERPGGAARARVEETEARLAEVRALDRAGHYDEGRRLADTALGAARALGWKPLEAQLLLERGRCESHLEGARGETTLHEAAAAAEEGGDDATAADAWTLLVRVSGFLLDRPADGHLWARYAEAAIRRLGDDGSRRAALLRQLASVEAHREERFDDALAHVEEARRLYVEQGGNLELEIAGCDELRGAILFEMGDAAGALPVFEALAALRARVLEPTHLATLTTLSNEAETLVRLGRAGEALAIFRTVLERDAATGAEEGYFRHRYAEALRAHDEPAAALTEDQRSLALLEREGRAGHWLTFPLTGEGLDLLALDRAAEAVAPLERAWTLRQGDRAVLDVAETGLALARALWNAGGDRRRARALASQAAAVLEPDAARYHTVYAQRAAEAATFLATHPDPR